jgi:hypothetical protein
MRKGFVNKFYLDIRFPQVNFFHDQPNICQNQPADRDIKEKKKQPLFLGEEKQLLCASYFA